MEYLPRNQIARPAASMSQALRFRQVRFFPTQLLCQQLLLGDVHCGTDESFENSLFKDRNSYGANVAQLPVASNNALDLIETTMFLLHAFNSFGHRGAVLRMYEGQILFNRGCYVLRIQPVNFVQLVRPIVA